MTQIASLYCKAEPWIAEDMAKIMLRIAITSLDVIVNDLDNPSP